MKVFCISCANPNKREAQNVQDFRHRLVAKPEVSPVQPPPPFNMKFLTPICLIALILAFGMALGQGNGGYDLLTCGESKGTNPDSDPEVDKHCV